MRWLFLIDIFDRMINPVMLRDLYRSMQNRFVMMLLLFYSIACITLASSSVILPERYFSYLFDSEVCTLLLWLTYAVCAFILPSYFAIASARDKLCKANLFRMTFLSPFKVIMGQMMASAIVAIILIIFILPFGLFCFFTGGMDISCITGQISIIFVLTCINLLLAFTFASIGRSWTVTIPFLAIAIACMATIALGGALYGKSVFEVAIRPATWEQLSLVAIVAIGLGGLLYISAATALSVSDANRALPVRCYLTGLVASWGLMAWYVGKYKLDAGPLLTWMEMVWFILAGLCVCTACERSEPTPRIQRMVPRIRLLRIPCYCLYSGSSNGFCWCALLGAWLVLLWRNFYNTIPGWQEQLLNFDNRLELYFMFYFALFMFCLSITVVLVRYVVFHDKYPRLWNFIVIIGLAVGMHFVVEHYADQYCSGQKINSIYSYAWLVCSTQRLRWVIERSNSFRMFKQPLVIYGTWAGFVTILLLPWHLHQIKLFKPLHDKPKYK